MANYAVQLSFYKTLQTLSKSVTRVFCASTEENYKIAAYNVFSKKLIIRKQHLLLSHSSYPSFWRKYYITSLDFCVLDLPNINIDKAVCIILYFHQLCVMDFICIFLGGSCNNTGPVLQASSYKLHESESKNNANLQS